MNAGTIYLGQVVVGDMARRYGAEAPSEVQGQIWWSRSEAGKIPWNWEHFSTFERLKEAANMHPQRQGQGVTAQFTKRFYAINNATW